MVKIIKHDTNTMLLSINTKHPLSLSKNHQIPIAFFVLPPSIFLNQTHSDSPPSIGIHTIIPHPPTPSFNFSGNDNPQLNFHSKTIRVSTKSNFEANPVFIMPRSSRSSKSHKHSSKVSGSDDDLKFKEKDSSFNGGKDDIAVVKGSGGSERRKHSKNTNGDVFDEFTNSNSAKKRDEKSEKSDRWNGGSSDEKGAVVNVENNKEVVKVKDFSKNVGESKSRSSRRHDGDSVSVVEKEKRKSEKESGRKESSLYKENKEFKDKEKDRGRRGRGDKVEGESSLKQVENQSSKRGKELNEWPIEEELRNPELEKELEKRMRRRGEGLSEKDKYLDDVKEPDDRRFFRSKDERHKDEAYEEGVRETRQRDEKHREDGERDRKSRDTKHREESERHTKYRDDKYRDDKHFEDANKDNKYKDEKYHETGDKDERKRRQDEDRDYRHKEEKHREVRHRDDTDREKRARDSKYSSRDQLVEPDAKRLRDDNAATDSYNRKTNNRDGSPVYDDRVSRYKDDTDRKRGTDKYESSEYRSRSTKEQRSESEKRDSLSERGRLGPRYPARDHHRGLKQEDTKYRDYAYEDRSRHNVHSSKDYNSAPGQSDKKVTPKDDGYTGGDISGERRIRPEVDKSPSSTSNERRNLTRSDARKSPDIEESGPRNGGSKDTVKDGKGSRDDNDFSQVDNDNLSVSSPYTRNTNSHSYGNSKSLLPPPSPSPSTFRTGSDGPPYGSTEDERNKSNNRHRRMVDQNMGRTAQGNNWKNVPNWPSPMANSGYMNHPFQHVPPPMFHPLMHQFPPPIFGRPPMKLNPGLPYHVPDHGPPPLHNWDANNAVFGDESHLYNRLEWDRRTQFNNRGWDQSGEMWKNQNAGANVDVQPGQQKDVYSSQRPNDEVWSGQTGLPDEIERNQMDIQTETLNLEKTAPNATQKVTESPQIFEALKDEDSDALIIKTYLSRIDVSQDLTRPELYEECTSMMDLEQESLSDEFDCKILFIEDDVEVNVTDGASPFAINDSVFQKAMFLYKRQKEELDSMKKDKIISSVTNSREFTPLVDQTKAISDEESKPENDEPCIQKLDTEATVSTDEPKKPENPMAMEVDHAVDVKQEEEKPPELPMRTVEQGIGSTNDEKNDDDDGGGGLVLSDVSNADVAVTPTESVEFGSVSLNRIHHHSPESTH